MAEAKNLKMENEAGLNSLASLPWGDFEKQALAQHPQVFRTTEPVSEAVRKVQIDVIKMMSSKRRQPKLFKAKLPVFKAVKTEHEHHH